MRNEIGLILHISKWFVGCSSLYLGYLDKREKRTCKKDYQVETKKDLIDVSKNLISFPCQMQGKAFEFQFPHFSCDIQNSFSCLTSQVTVACLIFNFQTSIRLSN